MISIDCSPVTAKRAALPRLGTYTRLQAAALTSVAGWPHRAHVLGADEWFEWSVGIRPSHGVVCQWGEHWLIARHVVADALATRIYGRTEPLLAQAAWALWCSDWMRAIGLNRSTCCAPCGPSGLHADVWLESAHGWLGVNGALAAPTRQDDTSAIACAVALAAAHFTARELIGIALGDILVFGRAAPRLSTPGGMFLLDGPPFMVRARYEYVMEAGLEIRVVIGKVRMRLSEIAALAPGAVVTAGEMPAEVELWLGEQLIGTGTLVNVDDQVGVRIASWSLGDAS